MSEVRLIDANALCFEIVKSGASVDFINKVTEFIKDAPTIEQQHWISCLEGLPELRTDCWVCSDKGYGIAYYDDAFGGGWFDTNFLPINVYAWMLFQPYEWRE